MLAPQVAKAKSIWQRIRDFRHRHETAEFLIVFFAGFAMDSYSLGRIDDRSTLSQQGLFLVALGVLLVFHQRQHLKQDFPKWFAWCLKYADTGIHFFLGSLLSLVTLFYFKSASGITSLVFILVAFGLLFANELEQFRALGPVVKFTLFAFCAASYFAYLLPVMLGFLSGVLFFAALVITALLVGAIFWVFRKWKLDPAVVQRTLLPGVGVLGLLAVLYVVKVIPPVPLAVQQIAVYHGVERDASGYKLLRQRPDWKFWQRGDQTFLARPGDKIFVWVQVFAPTKFADAVMVRWSHKDPKSGWRDWGAFPLSIQGGRDEGFRGYASKANYEAGAWRVHVETQDGREIGKINVTVEADDDTSPRALTVERG